MAKAKVLPKGASVRPRLGKHAGQLGTVEHSDPSITTVRFGNVVDPVWTIDLEVVTLPENNDR